MYTQDESPIINDVSDDNLALACRERNAQLRDVAIADGADAHFFLLCAISSLWSHVYLIEPKGNIQLVKNEQYLQIEFLLETQLNIVFSKTIREMTLELGPEILVLFFDYARRQGSVFNQYSLEMFLKDHLLTYMFSQTIDILNNRTYLKADLRDACQSVLKLNDIEFFAAIGDEIELKKIIETMHLRDGFLDEFNACRALEKACFFGRENTANLLINAGANVNFQINKSYEGIILYKSICMKQTEIIRLLLNCKEIDISIKPENEQYVIYDFAMQSEVEEIKALFQNKLAKITDAIQVVVLQLEGKIQMLRKNAQTWFGYGCIYKANLIEKALDRAKQCNDNHLSVENYLNYSQQNEISIAQALSHNRIYLWGEMNSTIELNGSVQPISMKK